MFRFQIVTNHIRNEVLPIYEGKMLTGHRVGKGKVNTLKLLGCGETQEAAEKMAGKNFGNAAVS